MTDSARRHRLVALLPIVWGVGSLISFEHPGDGYGLYSLSNFLGAWVPKIFETGDVHELWGRSSVAVAGGALLGWALDRLRVQWTVFVVAWLAIGGVFLYGVLSGFPRRRSDPRGLYIHPPRPADAPLAANGPLAAPALSAAGL